MTQEERNGEYLRETLDYDNVISQIEWRITDSGENKNEEGYGLTFYDDFDEDVDIKNYIEINFYENMNEDCVSKLELMMSDYSDVINGNNDDKLYEILNDYFLNRLTESDWSECAKIINNNKYNMFL